MSEQLLGGLEQRFRTQHEDDVVPVLLWFATSHALGFVAFQLAEYGYRRLGHTSTTTVLIVGGGKSMPMQMQLASYEAMLVQGGVFIVAFVFFVVWNMGVLSR